MFSHTCIDPGPSLYRGAPNISSLDSVFRRNKPKMLVFRREIEVGTCLQSKDLVSSVCSKDFAANRLTEWVTVRHRNVVEKGFPQVDGGVDAIFLDLPNPWEASDCWCT